jgi:hypothetical protein
LIKGEMRSTAPCASRARSKARSSRRASPSARALGRRRSVGQAKIEGTFKGNITAAERIELASTAHVLGDVRSTKLVIAEGATFVGNCCVSPDALKVAEKSEFVTPVAATPIKK